VPLRILLGSTGEELNTYSDLQVKEWDAQ